ncbi:hypothetical protein ACIPPM_19450 [Streptomyces sp. NPDC090119]|uniref:hypothetical protein n=1 Tax=Streptomyces sp. NPDC090119 TaxID=3365951 RepID=UPI003825ACFF
MRTTSSTRPLTGGHHNDVTQLTPLLQAVLLARGKHARPRRRLAVVLVDRGYDRVPGGGS